MWTISINDSKCLQITFTLRKYIRPQMNINYHRRTYLCRRKTEGAADVPTHLNITLLHLRIFEESETSVIPTGQGQPSILSEVAHPI